DGLLARVGWNGIDPCAAWRVTVPIGYDGINITELAGVVEFLALRVHNGRHSLAADLHDAVRLLRCCDHGKAIFDRMRHRLFAIDIFASGAGVFKHMTMRMVRNGYDDRVNIFASKNLAIVSRGRDALVLDRFLRGGMARVIEIANGNALDARHPGGSAQQFASADAGADGSKTDGIAGGNRAG